MRLLALCTLLALCAVPTLAADAKADVEKAEREWALGATAQNYALLEKVLGDDLSYTHSTGAFDTKRSFIDALKTGKAVYQKVDYDKLEVRVLTKDTAVTILRLSVKAGAPPDPAPAKLSVLHTFVLRKGQWQLVAHQSAKVQ
jgi:hypothetical protein